MMNKWEGKVLEFAASLIASFLMFAGRMFGVMILVGTLHERIPEVPLIGYQTTLLVGVIAKLLIFVSPRKEKSSA